MALKAGLGHLYIRVTLIFSQPRSFALK